MIGKKNCGPYLISNILVSKVSVWVDNLKPIGIVVLVEAKCAEFTATILIDSLLTLLMTQSTYTHHDGSMIVRTYTHRDGSMIVRTRH